MKHTESASAPTSEVEPRPHRVRLPGFIKDEEIETIKRYLSEKDASIFIISQEGFTEDAKIRVNHGVFMGNEGTVLRGGKKKVYVKLESLGQVMVVEFPAEFLSPIV